MLDKRLKKIFVCPAVPTQGIGSDVQGTVQKNGRAVLKRVGQWYFRVDPGKAATMKFQRPKKSRRDCQRMNSGTDVMNETGQSQRRGSTTAADGFFRFQQNHRREFSAERYRGSKAVRAAAHDDSVIMLLVRTQFLGSS